MVALLASLDRGMQSPGLSINYNICDLQLCLSVNHTLAGVRVESTIKYTVFTRLEAGY